MKLTALFLFLLCLQVNAHTQNNRVTLDMKNVPLEKVFEEIQRQTDLNFFFNEELIAAVKPVTVKVHDAEIKHVLEICFKGLPFNYEILDRTIVVKPKTSTPALDNSFSHKPLPPVVRGRVTNENGQPIPGATITIKGTTKGTAADNNGNFVLADVPENAVLVISSIGYVSQEILAKDGSDLDVRLKVEVSSMSETVVVAYNTVTTRNNIGAVSVVKGEQIHTLPNRSFERSLQGQVAGLLVTPGNGQPGGGTSSIILRGIGTGTDPRFGSTIRNPLFIIDGVQVTQDPLQVRIGPYGTSVSNPMAQINPMDIESITVLKDAAAIALYGSRASNGVILVTTKQGKAGKTRINLRHQTDISSRVKGKTDVLTRDEYTELLFESYRNRYPGISDADILSDLYSGSSPKFPSINQQPNDTAFYPSPDWYSELFSNPALTVTNDISVSGGNDYNTYYLNVEYTTQKGVVKKTGYDRASVRYNFLSKPAKWLNFGINSTASYNKQTLSGTFEDAAFITGLPYTLSPLLPVRLTNNQYQLTYPFGGPGGPGNYGIANPVAAMEYNSNLNLSYRGLGNLYAEISFLKYFKFRSNIGVDFIASNAKEKLDPRLTEYILSENSFLDAGGRIYDQNITRSTITTTNTLRYDQTIGKDHAVNVILGQEAQKFNSKTTVGVGYGLASPAHDDLTQASFRDVSNVISRETFISYFGQGNYTFRGKYLFSASTRRDGSSRFGEKSNFDTYWSTGLGWIISEEKFFKNLSWLNYFKIRGSVGKSGNSASISSSTRFDLLNLSSFAGIAPAVVQSSVPANPHIKAEQTFNQDLGIEGRLFNYRVAFSADMYKRKITDLLYTTNLPGASGFLNVIANIGDMQNKGVELSLSVDIIRNTSFRWNITGNWSTNKNKLIKANVPITTISGINTINKEGENFNSFYLVRWAGVNPNDGTPQWLDSTGKVIGDFNIDNRQIVGKPQPDGFGGITNTVSYKNFELTAFFYYQYGFQIYDNGLASLLNDGATNPYVNQSTKALNRWQKPGDIAENPQRILDNPVGGRSYASTRFLFDGDFIRLKNVSLSYNLPKKWLQKIKLSDVKIYVQGNNLALWTKYPGIDPENTNIVGESDFAYPQQKSFSVGLNAFF